VDKYKAVSSIARVLSGPTGTLGDYPEETLRDIAEAVVNNAEVVVKAMLDNDVGTGMHKILGPTGWTEEE